MNKIDSSESKKVSTVSQNDSHLRKKDSINTLMNFEIDHVFCFVDPELKELEKLVNNGFKANISRVHQGQGTANRCVFFKRNYFELIYLTSIEYINNEKKCLNRALYDYRITRIPTPDSTTLKK